MKYLSLLVSMVSLTSTAFAQQPPATPSLPTGPTFRGSTENGTPPPASATGPSFPGRKESEILQSLGPLASDLYACFSMDSLPNGSLVYARPGTSTMAMFTGINSFGRDGDRLCADFKQPPAVLRLVGPPFKIGNEYTFCAWMKLPLPNRHGVLFKSKGGTPLYLSEDEFMCWNEHGYAFGKYGESLTGWHHVAVACDGQQMSLFLDGALLGKAATAVDGTLSTIGNHSSAAEMSTSQCGQVDDVFTFSRALLVDEVAQVMKVRLPENPWPPRPFGSSVPPSLATSAAPAAPVISPETQAATAELVKDYRNSLVFVSGGEGSGSGFMANLSGRQLLVTNAHVAAGIKGASFKSLDGAAVTAGVASVAVGHDVFVMQAPPVGKPFEIMQNVEQNTAIGDQVVVLGNSEGAGVINTIVGRIVGVGPNLVEVDAPFQPGNSGSPIIHLKSGKVVGIATYHTIRKYDPATKQAVKEPLIRRFGYRLDSVKTWQPVSWPAFYAQAELMESIEQRTKDLVKVIQDISKNGHLTSGLHTNPAIKPHVDTFLQMKTAHMNAKDIAAAAANLFSYLKNACQSDVVGAQSRLTYDYFQRGLVDQQREREAISSIFDKAVQSLR